MAAGADFQVPTSFFMVKVNGTGCCRAAWGQMKRMSLAYLLHFIGVMQAVDGGQLLHGDPYPRLHPATAFVPCHLVFLLGAFLLSLLVKFVKFSKSD